MRLPTLKAIMAEKGCDINAARSIRARLEVEADRAHFRKTGRHALQVVTAHDLERHPELAVQDTNRPKSPPLKMEENLKTEAARVAYIRAAAEERTPDALPDAFADVFRAMGRTMEAALCESLAAYLRGSTAQLPGFGVSRRTHGARPKPRRKAATPAMA